MLFFAVLALCALVTALLVYRYDLYEHEPIPLLAVAIALGVGGMWIAGMVETWLLDYRSVGAFGFAFVAGCTEELGKLLVVVAVSLLARREFDDPMDGIVYGSMAGLGAALEESLFYVRLSPLAHTFVPAAELVRVWAHVVLGGIVGFPLGFWRAHPRRAAMAALGGLAVAAGLHFGWDALVLSAPAGLSPGSVWTLGGVCLMMTSLALYGRLVVLASARSRQQFAPGSALQLWGWPFHRSCRSTTPHPEHGASPDLAP
jgi:RsiW-degrading membrane proteinase PrsW (M82 family)